MIAGVLVLEPTPVTLLEIVGHFLGRGRIEMGLEEGLFEREEACEGPSDQGQGARAKVRADLGRRTVVGVGDAWVHELPSLQITPSLQPPAGSP